MTFLASSTLILAHLISWTLASKVRFQHSPVKLTTALSFLHTVPHSVICSFAPEQSLLFSYLGQDFTFYLAQFCILYSIAFLIHTLVLTKTVQHKIPSAKIFSFNAHYPYKKAFLFLFVAYLITVIYYFISIGGLLNFLANFFIRDELKAGMGIFNMFRFPFAYLAIIFLVIAHKRQESQSLIVFFSILIGMAFVEALFGGRRNPIQFLIFGYLALLILDSDKRLISKSSVLIASTVVFIFVGLYYFRSFVSLEANNTSTSLDIPIIEYILNISYNDIYIFVIAHFSQNDLWLGSIYADIVNKFGSYIFGYDSPSPDEGLYIYNLYQGKYVEPPMLPGDAILNSWPPRTFGNGYMNFGIPGVFILFAIKGALLGFVYRFMKDSAYNPIFIYLYLYMIFSFQLSNLKIFEFITILFTIIILLIPLTLIANWRKLLRKYVF